MCIRDSNKARCSNTQVIDTQPDFWRPQWEQTHGNWSKHWNNRTTYTAILPDSTMQTNVSQCLSFNKSLLSSHLPMTNFDISYALSMRIRIHTNHENKRPIYNQKPNALPWRQCKASRNSSNACFFPKAGWQCLQYRLTPKTHTYVPKLWKNHTWTFIHMGYYHQVSMKSFHTSALHNYIPSGMQWHQKLVSKCTPYNGFGVHKLVALSYLIAPFAQIWLLTVSARVWWNFICRLPLHGQSHPHKLFR